MATRWWSALRTIFARSATGAKSTWGTSILTVRPPTSLEKAVAAWPPPMLATSRSASSCNSLGSCKSVLQQPGKIENEYRAPAAQDRHSSQPRHQVQGLGQSLQHHFFLPQELVDRQGHLSILGFGYDVGAQPRGFLRRPVQQRR